MVRNLVVATMYLAAALIGAYNARALEKNPWPLRKKRLLQVAVIIAWLSMAYWLIQGLKL